MTYADLQFVEAPAADAAYSQYVKTNQFRAYGGDAVHASLGEAKSAANTERNARHEIEAQVFHTQARAKVGENGYIALNVPDATTQIPGQTIDHWVAFNHMTGGYERFETFAEAQALTDSLRQDRHTLIDSSYQIEEEYQGVGAGGASELVWLVTWTAA
jgi:hypothetical protein